MIGVPGRSMDRRFVDLFCPVEKEKKGCPKTTVLRPYGIGPPLPFLVPPFVEGEHWLVGCGAGGHTTIIVWVNANRRCFNTIMRA
jgi:hypothetical protein